MKNNTFRILQNLTFLTQLGISLAVPPVLCIFGAGFLQRRFGLGDWVLLAGILLGVGGSFSSLLSFSRYAKRQAGRRTGEDVPPKNGGEKP